jgi:multidrug efflux pump
MTSFAFILGCVPLWLAEGAGAVSRQIIGIAVIGGMLAASFIAIFSIPAMFYLVEKFSERKGKVKAETPQVEGAGASQTASTTEH